MGILWLSTNPSTFEETAYEKLASHFSGRLKLRFALGRVSNLNDVFCLEEKDLTTTSTELQRSNEVLKSPDLWIKGFGETFSCVAMRKVVCVVGDPGDKFSRSIMHFQVSHLLHRFVNHPVD